MPRVRITDLVNLLIPPQPLSRVRAAGAAGDSGNSRARQLLALSDLVTQGLTGSDPASTTDQATFSPAALSRAGQSGTASGSDPGVVDTSATSSSGDTSGPDLGGVTENYIRRRAILTYSLPAVGPNGAAISLTFDIEASQRTTRFFGPSGTQLDRVA